MLPVEVKGRDPFSLLEVRAQSWEGKNKRRHEAVFYEFHLSIFIFICSEEYLIIALFLTTNTQKDTTEK